jgi:HK97 family phage major capsid protein
MDKILKLKQARAEAVAQARNILDTCEREKRDLTENDIAACDEFEKKAERLRVDIEREERIASLEAGISKTAGAASRGTTTTPEGEFRSFGEWLGAAFRREIRPDVEKRAQSMGVGSEGGFLVPQQFLSDFLKINPESQIVRPRARVIGGGENPDAEMVIPALAQGASGVYGGVTVTWTAESAAMAETAAVLEQISLRPREVTAYVKVSNMLLRNAASASPIISTLLGDAVLGAEDYAFLRGDGVAKPLGIKNCPGRKTVVRTAANSICYEDILSMQKGFLPESQPFALWIANQSAFSKIKDMKDSSGNRIYTEGNLVKGFPSMLDGIPIRFTGRTPVLGSEGDLMLVDLRYYLIKDGIGPMIAFSEHVGFTSNQTYIKVVKSVDGQGWIKTALELEDGSTTVSPFAVLQ